MLGVDGRSEFNGLHSRKHDDEVQLYAFDVLALDGEDLRKLPLSLRKTNLARLLARRPDGIFLSATPKRRCQRTTEKRERRWRVNGGWSHAFDDRTWSRISSAKCAATPAPMSGRTLIGTSNPSSPTRARRRKQLDRKLCIFWLQQVVIALPGVRRTHEPKIRETAPLWVGMAIVLIAIAAATYLTAYLAIEAMVTFLRS